MKDEFYIGWSGEAPGSSKKAGKLFFAITILLALSFAVIFSVSEEKFIESYFEYGTLTEIEGYLVEEPVPGLLTIEDGIVQTIPLVGFGKFGAQATIDKIKTTNSFNIQTSKIRLRGTLFYYKDRKWMELTEGENSFISSETSNSVNRKVSEKATAILTGEIIDPKCFFGVMNPGFKAVHRSCGIRCISGGIPAVMGIRKNGQFVDYYFIQNSDGELIGKEVLPFVGIPVQLRGEVYSVNDWNVITLSEDIDQQAEMAMLTSSITICR